MQQTEPQRLLRGEMTCTQAVMCPHDIISALFEYPEVFFPIFTAEPGRLEKYWEENKDLRSGDLDTWTKFDQGDIPIFQVQLFSKLLRKYQLVSH